MSGPGDWKYGFGPEPAVCEEGGGGSAEGPEGVWSWGSDRAEFDQTPDRVLVQGVLAGRVVQLARVPMGHVDSAGQGPGSRPWWRGGLLLRADEVMVAAVSVTVPQSQHVPSAAQAVDGGRQGGLTRGQGDTGPPQGTLPWERGPSAQHGRVAVEQRGGGSHVSGKLGGGVQTGPIGV